MSTATIADLKRATRWHARHNGIVIEIVHWGEGDSWRPQGTWNYYIIIHEKMVTPEVFKTLWLEDKPTDYGRVSHDYYASPLAEVDMHGGITFYEKAGHLEGHRSVKFGCDYSHSFDEGMDYDLAEVFADAVATANEAIAKFNVTEPAK